MEWWRKRNPARSFDTCDDCGKPIYGLSYGYVRMLERQWRRGYPVENVHVRCQLKAAHAAEDAQA